MRGVLQSIRKVWMPEVYQGGPNRESYFEGWYFKFVDAASANLYAVIPGVSFERKGVSHAFVQVLDGLTTRTWYVPYPMDAFSYSRSEFDITIGENRFSRRGIRLRIDREDLKLAGELSFGETVPWPVTLFSPGAMGWYAFVPFMECYHGVISFDHTVDGALVINGKEVPFARGRGYLEKDWGTSFPRYYLWIQSNHFEEPGVSLMASLARIPWLGSSFDGFLLGFYLKGRLFRFTTYTGARIRRLKLNEATVEVHVSDRHYRLEIEAVRTTGSGVLHAPQGGAMRHRIRESMTSIVSARLFRKSREPEELIFSGTGRHAGLELGGRVDELQEVDVQGGLGEQPLEDTGQGVHEIDLRVRRGVRKGSVGGDKGS